MPFIKPDSIIGPSQAPTKEAYIDHNLRTHLKDEGEATLYNMEIRSEILRNGCPDIGVAGKYARKYQEIAAEYAATARDQARSMIGEVLRGEHPSVAPSKTYEQHYSEPYLGKWNTYQKLIGYRNSRRR